MDFHHVSVMLEEVLEGLSIKPGGIYVDCTLGGAGHSKEIAKLLGPEGILIGIDQDINAIKAAGEKLEEYKDRVKLVHNSFFNLKQVLEELNIDTVDGILMDLGVSSHQLDEAQRGFSYMQDAPLDMRMNRDDPVSAKELVNGLSLEELSQIIWDYGEERWGKRIAQFICEERKHKEIETTGDLTNIIKKAIPANARREGPHPAKRTFQALRIAVNNELEPLEKTLLDAAEALNKKGRLCVITFHSLEDRITKKAFQYLAKGCICPPKLPICQCGKSKLVKIITNKPIIPSEVELERNPRARSAKVRIAERV